MSQPNLDHGSYIPSLNTVTEELSKICDAIEAHFVTVGASLNEALRAAPWLPNAVKPSPRSPTPGHAMRAVPAPPAPPAGYYEVCKSWASQHRAVTAAVVAFVGTGVLVLWRRRRSSRRHLHRHARVQVVVLAGSPQSPLTRSLALDLQRRGFTVYIVINDVGEERLMQDLWRDHIRPLTLDITSPLSTTSTLENFTTYLSTPDVTRRYRPRLVSLIILPASPAPTGSIAALDPLAWSDTFMTHLVAPFTTIRAFSSLLSAHKPSILFLTPSIIPALTPPLHGLDNVTAGAMQSYISTLRKEVAHQGINVVQFKLGTFDYGQDAVDKALILRSNYDRRAEAEGKSPDVGATVPVGQSTEMFRGSPLHELHISVFDAIARGKGRGGTVFVGQGSRTYDLVSRWVPGGLIGWILELRKRRRNGDA